MHYWQSHICIENINEIRLHEMILEKGEIAQFHHFETIVLLNVSASSGRSLYTNI